MQDLGKCSCFSDCSIHKVTLLDCFCFYTFTLNKKKTSCGSLSPLFVALDIFVSQRAGNFRSSAVLQHPPLCRLGLKKCWGSGSEGKINRAPPLQNTSSRRPSEPCSFVIIIKIKMMGDLGLPCVLGGDSASH